MDGGNGITNDGAKAYMKLVTGTSATEMITYVSTLQKAGFTRTTSRILQADAEEIIIFFIISSRPIRTIL